MINGLREIVEEYASAVVREAAEALLDAAEEAAPEDSGDLKASRRGPEYADTGTSRITALIFFDAEYATYTDEGTEPHQIRAKNYEFLRFQWENGPDTMRSPDGFFYFKEVNHPGTTGTKWFTETVEKWMDFVQEAAQ